MNSTTHKKPGRAGGIVWLAASLIATGCGGSSWTPSSGALSLNITDAPIDEADAVAVAFTGVAVKPAAGSEIEIDFSSTKVIDLLALQGDASQALLEDYSLPAGQYNWIRLAVDESASYVEINGAQYPLTVPSGAESGLKLNRTFDVASQDDQGFTIDFDLRKSVHQSGNGVYRLRPTLRIVDDSERGHISGTIAAALVDGNADCLDAAGEIGATIYVFEGAAATPTDINIDGSTSPLTSADVSADNGTYRYTVGFLPAGTYTLALTCQADEDDAEQSDTITFLTSSDAVVTEGATAQHNFDQ